MRCRAARQRTHGPWCPDSAGRPLRGDGRPVRVAAGPPARRPRRRARDLTTGPRRRPQGGQPQSATGAAERRGPAGAVRRAGGRRARRAARGTREAGAHRAGSVRMALRIVLSATEALARWHPARLPGGLPVASAGTESHAGPGPPRYRARTQLGVAQRAAGHRAAHGPAVRRRRGLADVADHIRIQRQMAERLEALRPAIFTELLQGTRDIWR